MLSYMRSVIRFSCMTSVWWFWRFDVIFDILESFFMLVSVKRFDVNVIRVEPNWTFLDKKKKCSHFRMKLIKQHIFKPKCNCQKKSMQEKESEMIMRFELKILSLGITVRHHLAGLVFPNSYPRDGIFNQILMTIKHSYRPEGEYMYLYQGSCRVQNISLLQYSNDPKFLDIGLGKQCKPRSDCSSIRVYTDWHSVCTFCTYYSMVEPRCSNIRIITAIFQVSEYLGVLQYLHNIRITSLQKSQVLGQVGVSKQCRLRSDCSWSEDPVLVERSDQDLNCLPFHLHLLDTLLCGRATLFKF